MEGIRKEGMREEGIEEEAGTGGLKATAERRFPAGAAGGRGTDGPSLCPARREEPAEGTGQTCQRTCTQDRDCSGRRQCLCDGACGLSCVTPGDLTPASFCSPPPETDNGFYSGASYRAGGEVRYKCKRGYRLEGPETIRCQENQEWSGPAPTCRRPVRDPVSPPAVFCPPPGDIAEGYLVAVEKPQYRAGELVYYLCKRSYLLDGTNRVTCRGNGTWSPRPFCRARCLVPAQRSRVLYQGHKLWIHEIPQGQVQHGEIVTFYCRSQNQTQTQTQSCSYQAPARCFDGLLPLPACYDEPTWLQYQFFPKRVVSEIRPC
nr:beta-2-glycoprotein 1-like isoform X3 [Chrysemys picta bellii]